MTRPLSDIMQGIEQYRFSSELNLAAGAKAFRRALRGHELFRELAERAKEFDARVAVAERVEKLAGTEIDSRYENRYDAALSAYLLVLADTAQPELIVKTAVAAARAPNIWWTAGILRELITHALATGCAQVLTSPQHAIPATLVSGVDTQRALRSGLQKSWAVETHVTMRANAGTQILNVLRAAQAKSQLTQSNNVIVMPPPSQEGERVVGIVRGRSRGSARSKAAQTATVILARGRQLSRA
jgi:hypothetical protein